MGHITLQRSLLKIIKTFDARELVPCTGFLHGREAEHRFRFEFSRGVLIFQKVMLYLSAQSIGPDLVFWTLRRKLSLASSE